MLKLPSAKHRSHKRTSIDLRREVSKEMKIKTVDSAYPVISTHKTG
jgi:hypothetical protein